MVLRQWIRRQANAMLVQVIEIARAVAEQLQEQDERGAAPACSAGHASHRACHSLAHRVSLLQATQNPVCMAALDIDNQDASGQHVICPGPVIEGPHLDYLSG